MDPQTAALIRTIDRLGSAVCLFLLYVALVGASANVVLGRASEASIFGVTAVVAFAIRTFLRQDAW